MIENDLQYRVTQDQVLRFQKGLAEADNRLCLSKALRDALASQLEELQEQVRAYEASQEKPGSPPSAQT